MAEQDIVGIRICGRYQSQNIVNVMHYKIITQTVDEHEVLEDLCEGWETDHKTAWLALHNDAYSLMGLRAFSLTGDNKRPGIVHIDEAGSVVAGDAPSPICRVVTLYTDSDNYRRRGRIMLSGSSDEDFQDADGSVNPATIGSMEALGLALIANITASSNEFQPGLAPNGILPFEPFTSALGRQTPACVRSRRVRGFSIG